MLRVAVKSLLERIMEEIPYRRKANNAYNPMVLTKLVKNFRSHEKILNVPNELFYDSELEVSSGFRSQPENHGAAFSVP